ncbi:hypothetical protein [Pseudalkalibacillus salsuginis]|uniref:hypothetical protein n=1 Tax=Pseudalkalibacillus salsuginis TaxID=2910972 RepID=UPI001F22E83B|nr:hypothetical protein [Pseudalkalibacillus salsuginis]MCF6409264.1 hypothetical protein [Pseudalkalibacillus salsuginis]
MKNVRIWLHIALLGSFALPWLKIPFIVTVVPVVGYQLPFKTNSLANQLNSLGVMSISYDQIASIYVMLVAPVIAALVLVMIVLKRKPSVYLDSAAGMISVMCCLYILTNTGNIATFGFYVTLIVSLLLVASPLLHGEKEKSIRVQNQAVLK